VYFAKPLFAEEDAKDGKGRRIHGFSIGVKSIRESIRDSDLNRI
jgi:hypothetical protein